MKSNMFKIIAIIFAIGMISLNSCKKDKNPDTQSAQDDARGAYISAESFAAANDGANKALKNDCVSFKALETTTGVKFKLTFDNCSEDGHTKNGSLIVEIDKTSWASGAKMTITFDNFTVDDEMIDGTITSRFSVIGLLNMSYSIEAKNMKAVADGKTFEWSSVKTFKLNGVNFMINGTGSGINQNGVAYTTKYTDVLFKLDCEWPVSGIVEITTAGSDDPTIVDYDEDGKADCDKVIKVTKNGNSVTVNL